MANITREFVGAVQNAVIHEGSDVTTEYARDVLGATEDECRHLVTIVALVRANRHPEYICNLLGKGPSRTGVTDIPVKIGKLNYAGWEG